MCEAIRHEHVDSPIAGDFLIGDRISQLVCLQPAHNMLRIKDDGMKPMLENHGHLQVADWDVGDRAGFHGSQSSKRTI